MSKIKSQNTAEDYLSKMIEALLINKSKMGEGSLRWIIQTLEYTIKMLRQEIDDRRGECKCKK